MDTYLVASAVRQVTIAAVCVGRAPTPVPDRACVVCVLVVCFHAASAVDVDVTKAPYAAVGATSLPDYITRMKPEQGKIYFVTAESFAAAKNSPHLEVFRKKGVEVLLMYDRVDEWVTQHLTEFEKKPLQSVAKGRLELGKLEDEAEKKAQEKEESASKPLLERIKKSLGESVKDVRVTLRLTDSPACLVADEHDIGANFARMLKAAGQSVPTSKPILEINTQHPLVQRLNDEVDEDRFTDFAKVLFDQSMLAEGGQLEDPAGFVRRLNQLMLALGAK